MITVYLNREDPDSADIVDRLRELVVAHRVVYLRGNGSAEAPDDPGARGPSAGGGIPDGSPEAAAPARVKPPALVDDDTVVRGSKRIFAHLEMLELFLGEWSKFQTDACYCDADGNVE